MRFTNPISKHMVGNCGVKSSQHTVRHVVTMVTNTDCCLFIELLAQHVVKLSLCVRHQVKY